MTIWPEMDADGFAVSHGQIVRRLVPVLVPIRLESGNRVGTALYLVNQLAFADWFSAALPAAAFTGILSEEDLICSRESGLPWEIIRDAAEKQTDSDEYVSFQYAGDTYFLLSLPGNSFSYRYLTVISEKELSLAMSSSVQMLAIVAAVVAALAMLVIVRMVQSSMKPIQLIRGMLTDQKPSGNELIEIRNSVQRLIDENAAMSGKMEDLHVLQKSDFIRQFLMGSYESQDAFLSAAEEAGMNVELKWYMVGLAVLPSDAGYQLSPERMNQYYDDTVTGAVRILDAGRKAAVLAFADSEEAIYAFMQRRLEGLRAVCPGTTMSVSKAHEEYREGPLAYLEAENAFEMRFIRGNGEVIRFEPSGKVTIDSKMTEKLANRLRQAVRNQDAAEVSAALRNISRTMRSEETTLFDFRCMYNEIFNTLSMEAGRRQRGERIYDLFRLSECLSLDDLDILLKNVCDELLAKQILQAEQENIPENILRVKERIDSSFTDPSLSVSAIAEEFGLTDSGLSVAFKKAYHKTPLEMITQKRMGLAKELLLTTELPVKDIAVECGYYDISNFNRRFKAQTGMAPLQYRQHDTSGAAEEDHHE